MTRIIDEELIGIIETSIKKGVPLDKIPGIIGISPKTFHNWLIKGQNKEEYTKENPNGFTDLYEVVARGRSELIEALLDNILTVANDIDGNPKLATENSRWLLGKVDKDNFGNKAPVQININHRGEGRDTLTEAELLSKSFSPDGLTKEQIDFINGFDDSEIIDTEKVGGTSKDED